jgi:hypothetical protein
MKWYERIILWSVIVLIVIWNYLLTDWLYWVDAGQDVLWKGIEDLNEFVHRSS